jgi:hypothetical protein
MAPTAPPKVEPIPMEEICPGFVYLSRFATPTKELSCEVYWHLRYLNESHNQTHAPYTWGFTIYRATKCSDERFAAAVNRLEAWMRWRVRQSRFDFFNTPTPEASEPLEGVSRATDEIAQRLWNEIIEEYPESASVCTNTDVLDGEEDFSAVGRAFSAWASSQDKDTESGYTRNDQCLVIDDKALRLLETLPETPPEVKRRDPNGDDGDDGVTLFQLLRNTWVWLLDRVYSEKRQLGQRCHTDGAKRLAGSHIHRGSG